MTQDKSSTAQRSLYEYFASVYDSGLAAGYAIGRLKGERDGREDCLLLVDASIRAGLRHTGRPRELTAVDVLALLGDPARARLAEEAIDQQRLRWWHTEERHLERSHLRAVDAHLLNSTYTKGDAA